MCLFAIEIGEVALGVHLGVPIGNPLANRVHTPEVRRAPHFVCVQLVRALELVTALLLGAREENVARLEAQLSIPSDLFSVVIAQECNLWIAIRKVSHLFFNR